ncbi:EAL domain-containing protein [Clostridium bovifaecis]|uniref:EAL domain-containing protein n=1 Tax=Clostridium bovifaecis TaxID=2184719 RepID=A0A6I6FAM3_9CLOT|nr:EAL domain-containing protein [Clostridium bovifaecis]
MLNRVEYNFGVSIIGQNKSFNEKLIKFLKEKNLNVVGFDGFREMVCSLEEDLKNILLFIDYCSIKSMEKELLKIINRNRDRIKVIIMDSCYSEETALKVIEMGAYDYIIKDYMFFKVLPHVIYKFAKQTETELELTRAQEKLKESEERYRLAIDGVNDGIWDWNIKDNSVFFSPRWKAMIGFKENEMKNTFEEWESLIHNEDRIFVLDKLESYLNGRQSNYKVEYRIRTKSGKYKWMTSRGQAIWDEKGNPIRMAGSHTDITKQKETQEKLYKMAYYDMVTGLPNRRFLLENLEKYIENKPSSEEFAILFLDLDKFKDVNDTFGHDAGDLLLKDTGEILKSYLEEEDIIARWAGDEFVILKKAIQGIEEIEDFCQRIIGCFSNPWIIEEQDFYITTSIGIALCPRDGQNAKNLLKNADSAMYYAKVEGKNGYAFFDSGVNDKLLKKLKLESRLRSAVKNEEFMLMYQPQFDTKTKEIIGAEALIRWNHPQEGIINPDKFIPIAEESGVIVTIGEWVLRTAALQQKEWQSRGLPPLSVGVNLSAHQFQQKNLVFCIRNILEETGLPPHLLELEITEGTALRNISYTINILKQLMDMGVRIALDDFGTGYSSLNYLKQLPIHSLKIDRSFLEDIPTDSAQVSIAKTIIDLAHNLNLKVTAEGVENQSQFDFLKHQNCDLVQGYLLSKPISSEDFEKIIKKYGKVKPR